MYDFWASTNKQCLPCPGGFLNQPAHIMASLRLLDLKHRIWDHIAAIEAKEDAEVEKIEKEKAELLKQELGLA